MNIDIPDNSLADKIKEMVDLCNELAAEYGDNSSNFSSAASDDEIIRWESKNKITIPESYKDWLRFSNGSQIINGTATFFGIETIGFCNEHLPDDYVAIGELIGDGEVLCFSKSTNKFIRYNHGKSIEYQNFEDILNLILQII